MKTHNIKNVQHQETNPTICRTWSNSLRWGRISSPPNPNLDFLPFSNLKFSQLKQKKWKVKTCTCSVAWVEHCLFTNLKLMMPNKRDRSSPKYLFSWSSIWQWGSFQCKIMVGIASLRCGDVVPIFTLPWDTLNWAVELQLQNGKMKMVELVRGVTGRVSSHG